MIKDLISDFNRELGISLVCSGSSERLKIKRISSGSIALDRIIGGGFPLGRIVELYGKESTAKTVIAFLTIANAQKLGLTCALLDVERAYDEQWARKLGVDVDNLLVATGGTGEQNMDLLESMIIKEVDVIVVDSVAELIPTAELEAPTERDFMGLQARLIGKAIRKILQRNTKSLILLINQIREAVGVMYGSKEQTPGGRAIKHAASLRVYFRGGDFIKDSSKRNIGRQFILTTKKNKLSPPLQQATINFYFDGFLDTIQELMDLGLSLGLIERSGAMYCYNGQKYRGKEQFKDALSKNKDLLEKLKGELL